MLSESFPLTTVQINRKLLVSGTLTKSELNVLKFTNHHLILVNHTCVSSADVDKLASKHMLQLQRKMKTLFIIFMLTKNTRTSILGIKKHNVRYKRYMFL